MVSNNAVFFHPIILFAALCPFRSRTGKNECLCVCGLAPEQNDERPVHVLSLDPTATSFRRFFFHSHAHCYAAMLQATRMCVLCVSLPLTQYSTIVIVTGVFPCLARSFLFRRLPLACRTGSSFWWVNFSFSFPMRSKEPRNTGRFLCHDATFIQWGVWGINLCFVWLWKSRGDEMRFTGTGKRGGHDKDVESVVVE